MGQKVGASFAAYVQALVAKTMASVVASASTYGISGYGIAGAFDDTNWMTIARNVKLANGGADVYAMGTGLALAKVMPTASATSGFRYGEDGNIVKTGFLPSYKGVPLYEIGNALKPNTINGTPTAVLPDDMIYFIAMGSDKPIKVVIEGQNVVVTQDPLTSADHTYGMTIDMRIGVDAIVGSKFGYYDL